MEFERYSMRFVESVRAGVVTLFTSEFVQQEIKTAPARVQLLYREMQEYSQFLAITEEALALRNSYLKAGIVTPKSMADALHVSLASTGGPDVIVSWNFKHIVHFQKVPLYNVVNRLNGYGEIWIHSPAEVSEDAEDQNL